MTTLKTPEEVRGALARGYCSKENENKVLDAELIEGMAVEVDKVITQDRQHIAGVLCELLESEYNRALEKSQALIRQTLDPISSNER